jgi:hypothetical protein
VAVVPELTEGLETLSSEVTGEIGPGVTVRLGRAELTGSPMMVAPTVAAAPG